jgi:hypothetical protein
VSATLAAGIVLGFLARHLLGWWSAMYRPCCREHYRTHAQRVLSVEQIRCPECGTVQLAEVTQMPGDTWPTMIHKCQGCGYWINESDWEPGA